MSPLNNLRVLDFSRVLAGPFATMMLADLGAEVIKVERPDTGDDTRAWGPPFDLRGESTYFASVNRNKHSLVLDLDSEGGRAEARKLALSCDVLVENFRPDVMGRLGLGFEDIARDNPRLIYCSITGFGDGPGATLPGYDLVVQALGGLMSITGERDGHPQKVGVALVDVLAGLYATVGILAAREVVGETGKGQHIKVNLLMALLSSMVNQSTAFTAAGLVPRRMGNAHPSIAPYELFSTSDVDLAIAVGNGKQFLALLDVLGLNELAVDSRFANNEARVVHRNELKKLLEVSLRQAGASEWSEKLSDAGVPVGIVNSIDGAFDLAQKLGLNPFVTISDAMGNGIRLPRNPIEMSATPPEYKTPPPLLGEWFAEDGESSWS